MPNIAQWVTGMIDNSLSAAGTTAAQVGTDALTGAGVVYGGLKTLGEGAILAGLVFGAIVAFIIDKRFWHAAIFAGSGAVLRQPTRTPAGRPRLSFRTTLDTPGTGANHCTVRAPLPFGRGGPPPADGSW